MNGTVSTYSTEGLKHVSQFMVRGKRKSRVTGIEASYTPPGSDSVKLLVTTADSRIGLYNLRDKALEMKLKAHKAEELSIRAQFSDDGRYVICGSEDKQAYIWSITDAIPRTEKDRDKPLRPLEYFEASPNSKVNCAIMAPRETRTILSGSADIVYDICNPPPVLLIERQDSNASSKNGSTTNGHGHNRAASRHTISQLPSSTPDLRAEQRTPRSSTFPDNSVKNAAYQARSEHPCGPIIVTASLSGTISVFRQDCAFKKRKSFDSHMLDGSARKLYLRRALGSRSGSSIAGGSAIAPSSVPQPRRSYAGSVRSYRTGPSSVKSFGLGGTAAAAAGSVMQGDHRGELVARSRRSESNASQPSRDDRIERWREDVDDRKGSSTSLKPLHGGAASSISARGSVNELKSANRTYVTEVGGPRRLESSTPSIDEPHGSEAEDDAAAADRPSEPRRQSSNLNPLRLQGGQSLMFWNTSQHTPKKELEEMGFPPLGVKASKESVVSRLTSEECEVNEPEDSGVEGAVKCPRCGSTKYKAKERIWGFSKGRGLVCENCGWERRD
jgi:hypothetical protein